MVDEDDDDGQQADVTFHWVPGDRVARNLGHVDLPLARRRRDSSREREGEGCRIRAHDADVNIN